MGLFSRQSGSGADPLLPRADMLVGAAHILATELYTAVAEGVETVREVDAEQWDFVLTVAGVFVAASRLNQLGISEDRNKRLMTVVAGGLSHLKPDGIAGFEDCKMFFERAYQGFTTLETYKMDPRFLSADALGAWMVWNLVGHAPKGEDESKLVRILGATVTDGFYDWWKS